VNDELMLQKFADYLQYERKASELTRNAYVTDLNQLFDFLHKEFPDIDTTYSVCQPAHLRSWLFSLQDLSRRSLQRKSAAIRSFFRFVQNNNHRNDNPAADLEIRNASHRLPKHSDPKALQVMYQSAENVADEWERVRLICLLDLLVGCGLRRAEVKDLQRGDLDLKQRILKTKGKGGKCRQVPLPEAVAERMSHYLIVRQGKFPDSEPALLLTDKGQALYPKWINRAIKSLSSSAESSQNPHALRHAYASMLVENGADLHSVKELLGHASARTTQVYIHNSFERLRKLYSDAHPRSGKPKVNDPK